jgi:predicted phosphodiesterase
VYLAACGHEVSNKRTKQCRACYDAQRTRDKQPRKRYTATVCGHEVAEPGRRYCRPCYDTQRPKPSVTIAAGTDLERGLLDRIAQGAASLADLAEKLQQTQGQVLDVILAMKARGVNLYQLGEKWSLERATPISERTFTYVSRPDNTFLCGVASDQHLCSRYAREDVLADLYARFEQAKVDRVFNAGNWIDGEDQKNRFDLEVHGLEPQVKYLCERYPRNVPTYAIWGEDHEGWYTRRESIDIGRFTETQMRQAGRSDWHDLGFVEAKVNLVNANTGKTATLVVMHPGGGSSYAYSYRPQKIVESVSGGEKPNVLIIGHYHKLSCNIIRNVWTVQAGCGQDQTVFMRKKGLEAHVGGSILTLRQDPETGAIYGCISEQLIYYDRAYYNDRWSKTSPVVKAPRFMGGVVPVP